MMSLITDGVKAAAAPYLLYIKIGAVALCLAGVAYWHYHDRARAVAAAVASLKAEFKQAEADAKEKADKRLAEQRSRADKAVADYVASAAAFEQQIRIRQNELRKTSASLASCRLGLDVVRMLNDSRAHSGGPDRPSVGDPGRAVPNP